MPSAKTIKRRMASVTTTKKIMKAMNMVAASKLQKDKARLEAARLYYGAAKAMVAALKRSEQALRSPFFRIESEHKPKSAAYLIITGDRGLCGSYNVNLCDAAMNHIEARPEGMDVKLAGVGLKGSDWFRQRGREYLVRFGDVLETAFYEDAERIAGYLKDLYLTGQADEIYVAYSRYRSALTHEPCVDRLLPIAPDTGTGGTLSAFNDVMRAHDMRFDPDLPFFLERAVPVWLSAFVYTALLESSACEQAARMVSMDTAVNNAGEIITKLTRMHNRGRQAAITQEISELVSSTNTLNEK